MQLKFTTSILDNNTNHDMDVVIRAQVDFGNEPAFDAYGRQTEAACGDAVFIHTLSFLDILGEETREIPAEHFPKDWIKKLEAAALDAAVNQRERLEC